MTEVFGQSRMQPKDIELICKHLPDVGGRFVEIGSYCGASASIILDLLVDCHCICVDNLDPGQGNPEMVDTDYMALIRNYSARRSRMNVFFGTASQFVTLGVTTKIWDLVIVDGAHDFQSCYEDLNSAMILSKKIVVHDYCSSRKDLKGVKQATDKFCKQFDWKILETAALSAVVIPKRNVMKG